MGQIFNAIAFDKKTKTCCVMDADKFHANCYSFCGTVFSIHYLLRQKPYNVMWGGHYVMLNDRIGNFSREEDLLGLSTYLNYDDLEMNIPNLKEKDYYDKIEKICEYSKQWNEIEVWDEAKKYFEWEKTRSAKYEGFLLNHTKKQAVNLSEYIKQSKIFSSENVDVAIDLIPVLTETGEGTPMALYDGMSAETTEELAGTWCGDLLQIVDELPEGFQIINCIFADFWKRVELCYKNFGINKDGYLLKDEKGNLFEGVDMKFNGKRGKNIYIIRVELKPEEKKISYIPEKLNNE